MIEQKKKLDTKINICAVICLNDQPDLISYSVFFLSFRLKKIRINRMIINPAPII